MNQHPYNDMDNAAFRAAYLIAGFINNTLTEKEHEELDLWINESDNNMKLFEELTDEKNLMQNLQWLETVKSERSYSNELKRIKTKTNESNNYKMRRWLVAASVVLVVGVVGYFILPRQQKSNTSERIFTDSLQINPGGSRATLTLANGKVIDLGKTEAGIIASGNGSHVNKPEDGELVYERQTLVKNDLNVHTLSTPVSGKFKVTLSDGSVVWLNALSSIRYPAQFNAKERLVELQGEAYFEVSKSNTPFKVLLGNNRSISVLGTQFNVNNYADEENKLISLVEGKVRVINANSDKILIPGFEASLGDNKITIKKDFDMDEVLAWKNNLFVFHDAPIEQIMKQVERWYNVKVVISEKNSHLFNATILRTEPLQKLLRLLELNGNVHFKIDKNTVYVLP